LERRIETSEMKAVVRGFGGWMNGEWVSLVFFCTHDTAQIYPRSPNPTPEAQA